MKDVKKELEQDEGQDKIDTTKDKMMRVMRKMPNGKLLVLTMSWVIGYRV